MVGDRLDTDVLFGANNGLMSILTLRCVTMMLTSLASSSCRGELS